MPSGVARRLAKSLVPKSLLEKYRDTISVRKYAATYLLPKGWQESARTYEVADRHGPVPWYTYPAQMLLERVVEPHFRVFEYGSGNSSLWWAKRVAEVVSVEHDEKWATKIRAKAPSNLKVIARPIGAETSQNDGRLLDAFYALELDLPQLPTREEMIENGGIVTREFSAYVLELTKYSQGYFDVIVIDGMARVLTAWLAAQYLKPSGFIVFDNAERRLYNEAYAFLAKAGFKRIDFYGTGPVNPYEWCTSLYAKEFEWLAVNSVVPQNQKLV